MNLKITYYTLHRNFIPFRRILQTIVIKNDKKVMSLQTISKQPFRKKEIASLAFAMTLLMHCIDYAVKTNTSPSSGMTTRSAKPSAATCDLSSSRDKRQ